MVGLQNTQTVDDCDDQLAYKNIITFPNIIYNVIKLVRIIVLNRGLNKLQYSVTVSFRPMSHVRSSLKIYKDTVTKKLN